MRSLYYHITHNVQYSEAQLLCLFVANGGVIQFHVKNVADNAKFWSHLVSIITIRTCLNRQKLTQNYIESAITSWFLEIAWKYALFWPSNASSFHFCIKITVGVECKSLHYTLYTRKTLDFGWKLKRFFTTLCYCSIKTLLFIHMKFWDIKIDHHEFTYVKFQRCTINCSDFMILQTW